MKRQECCSPSEALCFSEFSETFSSARAAFLGTSVRSFFAADSIAAACSRFVAFSRLALRYAGCACGHLSPFQRPASRRLSHSSLPHALQGMAWCLMWLPSWLFPLPRAQRLFVVPPIEPLNVASSCATWRAVEAWVCRCARAVRACRASTRCCCCCCSAWISA